MSLFECANYRVFIRSFIKSQPKKGRGSINKFATHLGVHSSLISQVLTGSRDFSIEQAQELCTFFGLNEIESDYFILLVQVEKAGTVKLKKYFQKKLEKVKADSRKVTKRLDQDKILSEEEKAIFYSSWLYSAIRLYTSLKGGKNLEDVASRFDLSRAKAREYLDFLVNIQLCREDRGVYSIGPQRIHLPAESPFISRLHSNWRLKAIQRIENIDSEELMFTAPMSIDKDSFNLVREKIVTLIKEISDQVQKSVPDEIACVNFDLFWIKK